MRVPGGGLAPPVRSNRVDVPLDWELSIVQDVVPAHVSAEAAPHDGRIGDDEVEGIRRPEVLRIRGVRHRECRLAVARTVGKLGLADGLDKRQVVEALVSWNRRHEAPPAARLDLLPRTQA
jgi:hypothetical protein